MRGSHCFKNSFALDTGIIPAHAGLTSLQINSNGRTGDHPRACGAHVGGIRNFSPLAGSSPRMRGSPPSIRVTRIIIGIIPAHAGLTCHARKVVIFMRDHPRACGAHVVDIIIVLMLLGSSPRMRGSPTTGSARLCLTGIIPAHAGLTFSFKMLDHALGDHPRACGAHRG